MYVFWLKVGQKSQGKEIHQNQVSSGVVTSDVLGRPGKIICDIWCNDNLLSFGM